MVVKKKSSRYFTKEWRCGARSDRVILPSRDGTQVKVTFLKAPAGAEWKDISYPVDETVYMISGKARITQNGEVTEIAGGDFYYVEAGDKYTLNIDQRSKFVCVFSPTPRSSTMVDDN